MMWVVAGSILAVTAWGVIDPFVGLLGLLAVNILQPGEIYPMLDVLHAERVMAVVVFLSLLFQQGKIIFPRITKLFLLFWLAMFASVPLAFWRTGALLTAVDFGRVVLYHLLIVNLVNSTKRLRLFLIVFILLIGWTAGSGYFSFFHGGAYIDNDLGTHFARVEGLTSSGGNPNELGLTLVSALPLVALFLFKGPWRGRMIAVATAALSLWVLIFTGSRSSFLTLIFLLAVFTFSSKKRVLFLPIAVGLLALMWTVMPVEYQQRYLSVDSLKNDESYQLRITAWHSGWHMFVDNPLTGVGAGQFGNANGAKYWPLPGPKVWMNAHSLYVVLIAELGIVGALTFGAYLFGLWRLNRSLRKKLFEMSDAPKWLRLYPTACNFCLLALLIAGYSSHDLYRSTWYMLGALSGCVGLLVQQEHVFSREDARSATTIGRFTLALPAPHRLQ